jgi:hypothetical protein
MSEIKLKKWQESVVDWLQEYDDYINTEEMQSLQQYDLNCNSSLSIKMPKGYGHTFLTAYLSDVVPHFLKHDSAVVYFDTDHLKEIEKYKKDVEENLDLLETKNNTIYISVYELYYAINENMHSQNVSKIANLKSKINGNIIIVDRSSSLPMVVKDFILTVASNAVVFLG